MATPFNVQTLIVDFARRNRQVTALKFINDDPDGIEVEDLGGFVNYVYRVYSAKRNQSIVIKHAKDTIKRIPSDHLPLERQQLEYSCMELFTSIAPGSVPRPYCLDVESNIIAMEYLSGWQAIEEQLDAGKVDMAVAGNLGHLLACIHQSTSKTNVSPARWEEFNIIRSKQCEMKTIMGNYLWKKPYDENDNINYIPGSALNSYRQYVRDIKSGDLDKKMIQLYEEDHCMIHADCHGLSIFVKNGEVKLFDLEFGFLSHPAQNLGFAVMVYLFSYRYYEDKAHNDGVDMGVLFNVESKFQGAVKMLLDTYLDAHHSLSEDSAKEILPLVALFAGGVLFAKSVFFKHSRFKEEVCILSLHTGYNLMKKHLSIQSTEALVKALFVKYTV